MDKTQEMQAKMLKSIEEKTGIHPDKIVQDIKKQAFEKHGEKVKFVKEKYALTHGFANLLAHLTKGEINNTKSGDLVEEQYKGKEQLLPIYKSLCDYLKTLEGVELSPKKAYVSVRTGKQFAIIQPSTKTRLDLGLKYPKDYDPGLEPSGSFNSMVTHRIRLESQKEVTKTVLSHIEKAYQLSK